MPHSRFRSSAPEFIIAFVLASQLLALASPAGATVYHWNNVAGGSAGTSTNWNPVGLPGAPDNLIYSIPNIYSVDFPASVPQVISQAFTGGNVTLTTSSPHVTTTSWNVDGGVLTAAGANIKVGSAFAGISGYGHFTITSSSGFPTTPARFEVTDSTQTTIFGNAGRARVEIFGGSQYFSESNGIVLSNTPTARCTLIVAGRSVPSFQASLLETSSPTRGNLELGLGGPAEMSVSNGGIVQIAGRTELGPANAGVGHLTVSATNFAAHFTSNGPMHIGGNQFGSQLGGSGTLTVGNRGLVNANDFVQVGDPDGGGSSSLIMQGGELIAANGLTVASNGNLSLQGGILNLIGGKLGWPAGQSMIVAGPSAPELWINDGQTNDFINAPITGLFVGFFSDSGTLRVTGANTVFGTTGTPCIVGGTNGVPGTIVVDSLARFNVGGYVEIGSQAKSTITVAGGAQVRTGSTNIGASTLGNAVLTVQGPGSLYRCTDLLTIGGTTSVPGAYTSVLVDSGGALRDSASGSAGSVATVQGPQGHLTVSNDGALKADTLHVLGTAETQGGTFEVRRVLVTGAGLFGGRGTVTGTVVNSNVTHAKGDPRTFGALAVNGAFSQTGGTKLRLGLGHGTGPVNDSLVVGGAATLAGILALEADPSFQYAVGDSYTVVTYGSRSGTFDALTWNGNFAGQVFEQVYQAHRLVVVVKTASVGVEGDGSPTSLRFAVRNNATRPELVLDLPSAANVRIDLYDVNGRRVASVHDGALAAGRHTFAPMGAEREIVAGVYFARAMVSGTPNAQTLRVVLLK